MTKRTFPKLYAIIKNLGFSQDSDEELAMRAAFVLGQKYMRDRAIAKLGDYDALKCAQIIAGMGIHSGKEKVL